MVSAKRAQSFIKEAQKILGTKEKKPEKKKETKAKKPKAKAKAKKKEAKAEEPKTKAKSKKPEKATHKKAKAKAEKPKKKAKKPKVEVPARVKATDQRLLRISKNKKKHMPQFRHEQAHRWIRVSDSWRKVRGIDNATREKRRGRIAMVSSGYRTPKAIRGLHPSLYREVHVHRPADLEGLDPEIHAVRIAGTVGDRKRQAILDAADEKELYVLNPRTTEELDEEDLFLDLDMEVD
jgi:large subunit ribosomal protein L32e